MKKLLFSTFILMMISGAYAAGESMCGEEKGEEEVICTQEMIDNANRDKVTTDPCYGGTAGQPGKAVIRD